MHIDRCDNLERLKINAPKLRVLKADNNAKLKEIDPIEFHLIDLINIDNSPLLTRTILKAFGKADWEEYFGDVGLEPPLSCKYWKDIKRTLFFLAR